VTFADIKTEIGRRLAEVSGRVFWTDAEIATAANDGYAEISDQCEWFESHVDIALLNDHWYYDLRTVIGGDLLSVKPAFDRQTNRWLLPSSVRLLDAGDRRWERVTGEPQREFLRGLWWLGFYPRIQADVGLIKQYYTALPPVLVEDLDEPGFPDTFHYGLVEFALTDLWAQDGEAALALQAWAEYLRIEGDLASWVGHRASVPMMHVAQSATTTVQR
jgi:hypothetical protein